MNRKEEIIHEIKSLKTKVRVLKKELYEIDHDDNDISDDDDEDDDNKHTNFIYDSWNNPPYKKHPDYMKWDQDRQKYGDDKNMPMDLMYYEYPDLYKEWYKSVSGKFPDKIYDKILKCDVECIEEQPKSSYVKTGDMRDIHFLSARPDTQQRSPNNIQFRSQNKSLENIVWPSG